MGGLFSGKKPKAPVPKKVAPPPTVTTEAEDEALQRTGRRRGGWAGTIITGDLVPSGGGKKTFG